MLRPRASGARRTWPQRVLLGFNVVLVLACLGAAGGLAKIRSTIESVPTVDIGSSLTPTPELTEPRNFLIIGTDSDEGLDPDDPVTRGRSALGTRSDVIMILRVDPRDGTARLLSIPRDTRVEVAPRGVMDRINTAIEGPDGPQNLVQTIKRNFGISIDNYVEIDFEGFTELVEVLDGVPFYFAAPVRDRETGLVVDEPGCITLDPGQALAYARSRNFEYRVDGRWRIDGTGDLGRITRQQDFIKRSLRRAADKGIRNPSTAVGIVNAATSSVRLDDTLDVGTIRTLVSQFQSFNPDTLESLQLPTVADERGGVAYQSIQWDLAEPMLELFRGRDPGEPLTVAATIVDVVGPERDADRLELLAAGLDGAGFDAEAVSGGAERVPEVTTLSYGPDGRDAALLVAAQLETTPRVELDSELPGARVLLAPGTEPVGLRAEPLPLEQLPADLVPPDTTVDGTDPAAPPSSGEDAGPGPSPDGGSADGPTATTTTSIPGVVPTDPEKAAVCR